MSRPSFIKPEATDTEYPRPRIQEILDRLGSVEGSEFLLHAIDVVTVSDIPI